MKTVLSVAALCLLLVGVPALAADAASVMADIVAGMNHFPSDEQKATLAEISANDEVDPHLRTIAEAIADVEHQPSEADQQKLAAIAEDDSASEEAKTLASALLRFNHKASSEDVAALNALSE